jgi:tRNA threonylcarbamoyladenosine biosynthesis protein TsaB
MNLLAIETATEACSVAVQAGGQVVERFEIAPRRHAELVLPWAEALLAQAGIGKRQLDAIAVSRGPGAFTGVRLGIALAQGMALALDIPLVPVSTLAVLARQAPAAATHVLAAIDARMDEVYVGEFLREGDTLAALGRERVLAPDDYALPDDGAPRHGIGTGFAAVGGRLATRLQPRLSGVDATALPHAADLLALAATAFDRGQAVAPELAEPAYLRDNVALTLEEQQAARAAR